MSGRGWRRLCAGVTVSFFGDGGGVEGGPGVRAGVAGGAELREAPGAITSACLSGTGRGKDSRLRSSRRCQCGWARERRGCRAGRAEKLRGR